LSCFFLGGLTLDTSKPFLWILHSLRSSWFLPFSTRGDLIFYLVNLILKNKQKDPSAVKVAHLIIYAKFKPQKLSGRD
jgi:hypothetical protein